MFRITEDPSSESLVQYLDKITKHGSIVSINTDTIEPFFCNFSQVLYKAPWWWILCDPKHVRAILNIL